MALVGAYLIYVAFFRVTSVENAEILYILALFLFYAASRRYFGHPVFETVGGALFGLALFLLLIGFGFVSGEVRWHPVLFCGVITACIACLLLGMEFQNKQLRERARRLGIEDLMFPKK